MKLDASKLYSDPMFNYGTELMTNPNVGQALQRGTQRTMAGLEHEKKQKKELDKEKIGKAIAKAMTDPEMRTPEGRRQIAKTMAETHPEASPEELFSLIQFGEKMYEGGDKMTEYQKAQIDLGQERNDISRSKKGTNLSIDPETGMVSFSQGGMNNGATGKKMPLSGNYELDKKLAASDAKTIEAARLTSRQADNMLTAADEFDASWKDIGDSEVGKIQGHISPYYSGNAQKMQAAGNKMALLSKEILGMPANNFSDADRQFLVDANPGLTQDKDVSKVVSRFARVAGMRVQEYSNFLEAYAQKNGSLSGANAQWQRFGKENSILQSDGQIDEVAASNWSGYLAPPTHGGAEQNPGGQPAQAPSSSGIKFIGFEE